MGNRRVNLIPFNEPSILSGENISNVVIFVPLGVYAGILFERWISGKKLFFFFLLSLIVEGLQFVLAIGAFDITDIITNTFGAILGLMIFKAVEKAFNSSIKAQKCINLIAAR
jgi:glycopeptide antibiotics resistance protein